MKTNNTTTVTTTLLNTIEMFGATITRFKTVYKVGYGYANRWLDLHGKLEGVAILFYTEDSSWRGWGNENTEVPSYATVFDHRGEKTREFKVELEDLYGFLLLLERDLVEEEDGEG